MGKPMLNMKSATHGAITELLSGVSALNMPPDPLEKPTGPFLSESDRWVKHAIEHFDAARDYILEVDKMLQSLINAAQMLCPDAHFNEDQKQYVANLEKALYEALREKIRVSSRR